LLREYDGTRSTLAYLDFTEPAPAKVNLTLRVVGRRPDGYHDLESLVCFARTGDRLTLRPGDALSLKVIGPRAEVAGPPEQNLVLKAARALAARIPDVALGHFTLLKRLPAGAGLGGGSSDAGAVLRLLVRANGLALDDPRIAEAARATGADVPVCVDPNSRWMRGLGEILSDPVRLPALPAVLVFPGAPLATKDVFAAFHAHTVPAKSSPSLTVDWERAVSSPVLLAWLKDTGNDLERPATAQLPLVADVLTALRAQPGCRLARMSGSGSACFGIFASGRSARAAARALARPQWWVEPTYLGG
jgi:4-diphosphocytidyl-2-C-methyl-D-erythritol kinase